MFRVDVLVNAVPEVKDMAFALAKPGENGRHLFFDARRGGIQHRGIHIALQGDFMADATPRIGDIGSPVEPQRIAAGFRHRFQPLPAAFGKQGYRYATAFVLTQQTIDDEGAGEPEPEF